MFLQSWASRFRRQKTSISDVILGPETRRKSFKTDVRKRMENQSPFGHHFCRFWSDFGVKTDPKIVQKSSKIALLSHFGRSPELRRLQGTNLDVSGSIRDQFWRDFRSESHSRARFSAVPPAESRSRARFGHLPASKSAETRA